MRTVVMGAGRSGLAAARFLAAQGIGVVVTDRRQDPGPDLEIALAKAKSRQIPLGPVDAEQLSEEVRKLTDWSREGIDLRSLLPDRRECLKWLQDEYLK